MNPGRSKLSGKVMTVGAMLVLLISLSWADEQSDMAKRPAASADVMDESCPRQTRQCRKA